MLKILPFLLLLPLTAMAQQPTRTDSSFTTQIYLMAKMYADRVEVLEKRIEELTAKCGDRCTPPIPEPPVASTGGGGQK